MNSSRELEEHILNRWIDATDRLNGNPFSGQHTRRFVCRVVRVPVDCDMKTFAEQMSKAELDQRMKGSAVAVNTPGMANPKVQAPSEPQPQITSQQPSKPGDIGAFKGWVKDL